MVRAPAVPQRLALAGCPFPCLRSAHRFVGHFLCVPRCVPPFRVSRLGPRPARCLAVILGSCCNLAVPAFLILAVILPWAIPTQPARNLRLESCACPKHFPSTSGAVPFSPWDRKRPAPIALQPHRVPRLVVVLLRSLFCVQTFKRLPNSIMRARAIARSCGETHSPTSYSASYRPLLMLPFIAEPPWPTWRSSR